MRIRMVFVFLSMGILIQAIPGLGATPAHSDFLGNYRNLSDDILVVIATVESVQVSHVIDGRGLEKPMPLISLNVTSRLWGACGDTIEVFGNNTFFRNENEDWSVSLFPGIPWILPGDSILTKIHIVDKLKHPTTGANILKLGITYFFDAENPHADSIILQRISKPWTIPDEISRQDDDQLLYPYVKKLDQPTGFSLGEIRSTIEEGN